MCRYFHLAEVEIYCFPKLFYPMSVQNCLNFADALGFRLILELYCLLLSVVFAILF